MKTVLLGVTGSIAAYKAAEITRLLKKADLNVVVIMTDSAQEFIAPLTFQTLSQNSVVTNMFEKRPDWHPIHISLADSADTLLIAPATANIIAKLANGIADDILSCTALSLDCPIIIAPAMNDKMWMNPATQQNVETLKQRGVKFINIEDGELACGTEGKGRLASPETIVEILLKVMI
ncbi:MAG: phosphopantothenoylcysteine decarboxylase [Kiritimatiellae bacterium]|jgi:phosphopantothenoylcysteine decarboxylase/phosphopantothenate--cysteine ligase|nr:phosphopantothenoylcysteine decarboxylase [Kiritimatiellia bacterium]